MLKHLFHKIGRYIQEIDNSTVSALYTADGKNYDPFTTYSTCCGIVGNITDIPPAEISEDLTWNFL